MADPGSGAEPQWARSAPDDDLFSPSIEERSGSGQRPWRVGSILWVYFFGGVLAGGVIAYLNSERLGAATRTRQVVVGLTALGLGLTLVAAALVPTGESPSSLRLASRVIAVVVGYVPVARLLRTPERAAQVRGVEPASLWGPGFAATLGLGLLQALLVTAVVSAV